jgi:hypothetical protein
MLAIFAIRYCIIYSIYFAYIIVRVEEIALFEHVGVIRCDIKRQLVKKCRKVENEPILGKKQR